MDDDCLAPPGYVTLMSVLDRCAEERGLLDSERDEVPLSEQFGTVNTYAGGITWVDAEYDERLGPIICSSRMPPEVQARVVAWKSLRLALLQGQLTGVLVTKDGELKEVHKTAWAAQNAAAVAESALIELRFKGVSYTGHVVIKNSDVLSYLGRGEIPRLEEDTSPLVAERGKKALRQHFEDLKLRGIRLNQNEAEREARKFGVTRIPAREIYAEVFGLQKQGRRARRD